MSSPPRRDKSFRRGRERLSWRKGCVSRAGASFALGQDPCEHVPRDPPPEAGEEERRRPQSSTVPGPSSAASGRFRSGRQKGEGGAARSASRSTAARSSLGSASSLAQSPWSSSDGRADTAGALGRALVLVVGGEDRVGPLEHPEAAAVRVLLVVHVPVPVLQIGTVVPSPHAVPSVHGAEDGSLVGQGGPA